jgi:hypothetical protein
MSGLIRRLNRGRAATDVEATPQDAAASQPADDATDAPQGGAAVPVTGDAAPTRLDVPATAEAEAAGPEQLPGGDLPAGVDPAELAAAPDTSARRGRLRRRLRYLRATRELLLRDLGGLVHEALRSEAGLDGHRSLVEVKSRRLATLHLEVRELESRLGETHGQTVLRQPGIGGTCPNCGELHGSEARFCSRCGVPLTGPARGATAAVRGAQAGGSTIAPAPADEGGRATTASLWGRPKRPSDPAPGDATVATGEQALPGTPKSAPVQPEPPAGTPDPLAAEGEPPAAVAVPPAGTSNSLAAEPKPTARAGAPAPAPGDPHVTSGDPLLTTRPPVTQRARRAGADADGHRDGHVDGGSAPDANGSGSEQP